MQLPRTSLMMLAGLALSAGAQEEEYSFDVEEFEPKTFEFTGYVEGLPEHARANQDGALYQLQFFDRDPKSEINRFTGTLELEGRLRRGDSLARRVRLTRADFLLATLAGLLRGSGLGLPGRGPGTQAVSRLPEPATRPGLRSRPGEKGFTLGQGLCLESGGLRRASQGRRRP